MRNPNSFQRSSEWSNLRYTMQPVCYLGSSEIAVLLQTVHLTFVLIVTIISQEKQGKSTCIAWYEPVI